MKKTLIENLDEKFTRIDGTPMEKNGAPPITLRRVMVHAILDPREQCEPEEKVRRYNLAHEIQEAKIAVELSENDIQLIKNKVGQLYPPIVVGQAWNLLDQKKIKL